jgi:hypothetical protein
MYCPNDDKSKLQYILVKFVCDILVSYYS